MPSSFSFAVRTRLSPEQVWELLTDIRNWSNCSVVYSDLAWRGEPWQCGSMIVGNISYPVALRFSYTLREFEPPCRMRYLAESAESGFAAERTIQLERTPDGTILKVTAFAVGEPLIALQDGTYGFLKALTEKWFQAFASFCDSHAATHQ